VIERSTIVATARSLIGTPFRHQGRDERGLDCAGLLIVVAWRCGIWPAGRDVNGYGRIPDGRTLRALCDESMTPIERDALTPGDAILVCWRDGLPQHLGIAGDYRHGGLSMIHAEERRRASVIETRLMFDIHMRYVAAYRMPEVG
jgi:cell wall-associated NlpC family hydrolase